MGSHRTYDVSVIVPFRDDEDLIGTVVNRLATHLRSLHVTFEILAIDEDSGDNSHAVLALLRTHFPELRVNQALGPGRGFDAGIRRAQGRTLWLIQPTQAMAPLSPFTRALGQVARGQLDAVIVRQRFVVAHRLRTLDLFDGLKGAGLPFQRRFARRATVAGLRIEQHALAADRTRPAPERSLARFFGALAPARRRTPPPRLPIDR